MESIKIKGYFSCSFKKADKDVVKYFHSVCKGLDIEGINVDRGYSETPAEKARELISESRALIAIATKRTETTKGKFNMPDAVNNEIAMAFGLKNIILPKNQTSV